MARERKWFFPNSTAAYNRLVKRVTSIAAAIVIGATTLGYQLLRPEPVYSRHVPITTKIVFNREIAQIFQKKCFQCHTDGNVAMALTTYKETRPWAVSIKEEILERKMPPWSAAGGYGHFTNDMSLTAREISLILSWTDGGAPSGVLLADEDKQPVFVPSLTSWEQGEPDEILKVAEKTTVAAAAPFRVERFKIANPSKQTRWLRSLQFKPADRRVVRYVAVYEKNVWLGTWTPSNQVSAQPTGSARPLQSGGTLTVEIGYRGNPEGDFSGAGELGLYFIEKPPAALPMAMSSMAASLSVAPGKTGERFRSQITVKAAIDATALWPVLGAGARSFEVTALHPDGTVEPMLWLNNYRSEWPTSYILKEPVALSVGTRLVVTTYYDNPTDTALDARPSFHITGLKPSRPPATLVP